MKMGMDKSHNIHPGETLLEEFLCPMEISQTRLSLSIGALPRRINEILPRKCGIAFPVALIKQACGLLPVPKSSLRTRPDNNQSSNRGFLTELL
jgi:hypothetical protein